MERNESDGMSRGGYEVDELLFLPEPYYIIRYDRVELSGVELWVGFALYRVRVPTTSVSES